MEWKFSFGDRMTTCVTPIEEVIAQQGGFFVVDGKDGLTAADEELSGFLRQTTKPMLIAVNKAESQERQLNAAEFWVLGIGEPIPISAYHGIGVGDLLDMLLASVDAETGAPPSRQFIRDQALTLLLAGHATTANALAWCWHLLAAHPASRPPF